MAQVDGATPESVAAWMVEQLDTPGTGGRTTRLYQETAVYEIEQRFGAAFTYLNERGNPAIDKRVLRAFRRLTEASVIWERGEKAWRYRTERDGPGRQQE